MIKFKDKEIMKICHIYQSFTAVISDKSDT